MIYNFRLNPELEQACLKVFQSRYHVFQFHSGQGLCSRFSVFIYSCVSMDLVMDRHTVKGTLQCLKRMHDFRYNPEFEQARLPTP